MSIIAESTTNRILVTIIDESGEYILQRAKAGNVRTWLTYTSEGFIDITDTEKSPKLLDSGDFVDSFGLTDGLYEYRYIDSEFENPTGKDYCYTTWIKFGTPDAVGYSFNNYKSPEGKWGTAVTPDDCRYTFLWGTDFKATNGTYFSDEQIQWFIDAATREVARQLNITIVKNVIKSSIYVDKEKLEFGKDFDEEETPYDYSERKITRYGMIQTKQRPLLQVDKVVLLNRGECSDIDLTDKIVLDKKQGVIKFLHRPFTPTDTHKGVTTAISRFGRETFQPHLFYAVNYTAGYLNSDRLPDDLRQIIGKVAAISLLNIIGDGLMSGFSSSSLSMDGVSESFSSTQSATSAYFGARIKVYQDEVKDYIKDNKYRFGFVPIGCL